MSVAFALSTVFTAKDRISGAFRRMGNNADKFGRQSEKAFKRSSRAAKSFGDVTKGILKAQVISKGVQLLTAGVSEGISEFIKFDDVMTAAAVRFKDIGPEAKNFSEQLKIIKDRAREAGGTTVFTATQAGEALDFLARAGWSSAEAMGGLNSMIALSVSTGEDFARVADISSDLLGAFGMAANDPIQKIKNLNRLNDVLVKTTNSANVTVEDMFETMKTVGPVATGILGASLEEVAALTGVLGSSGIKGSMAMTALKNAYLRLAAPTSRARERLFDLNVSIDDGEGGARKLTDVLADLGKKMQGMSKVKQAEILDELFGKRAIAGSKNIMNNIANIKAFEAALLKSGGTAQKTADIMKNSLGNRLKLLNSAFLELTFKTFDQFDGRGKGAIDRLTEAVSKFDVTPIINGIERTIFVFDKLFYIIDETIKAAKWWGSLGGGIVGDTLDRINPLTALGNIGDLIDNEIAITKAEAPNKKEAEAKAQNVNIQGLFSFENAPQNMTFKQGQGPLLQTSGLGSQ